MSITNLNGSVQQATPIAVQLADGTWTDVTGGNLNQTLTILSGTSLSSTAIDCGLGSPIAIFMDAGWDAAKLTFQVSYNGTTYVPLHNADDTEYALTVSAGNAYILPPSDFAGIRYLKLRSGTNATPVNQTSNRLLIVASRQV
jgi:hypothetical protein